MKLPAYCDYRPTGVEWIGDVPAHWLDDRIKHSTYVKGRIGWQGLRFDEFTDDGPFLVTGTDFKEGRINWKTCYHISPERYREDPFIQLKNDDVLITKDGTIGKVAVVENIPGPTSLNSGVFVTRPKQSTYIASFMYWLLNSDVFTGFIDSKKSGTTIAHLYQNVFVEFAYPVPPLQEQRTITEFLDRETAKLDTLVGKKRELIEKLKEKRTALISRTVTRGLPPESAAKAGLNSRAKLKPSGIEWLGDIPQHWELSQLRRRITLQRGVDITKDGQNEGSIPVVSSGGISSHHDVALVRGPGVVVGRKGTAGAVYYIQADFWPHDTTLYVREYRGSNPRYVYYKLLSMNLQNYDTGSANPTVNRNIVHPEIVSWPSRTEQNAIADYLDRETAKIDKMMEKVEAAIEKLQEYRTALITAAVTGKIDVSGGKA